MGGVVEDHAERERVLAPPVADVSAERRAVAHAGISEGAGEGEGVAVEIEDERGENIARRAAEPGMGGPERGRGGVNGVEFAVDDFFANGGPVDLALKLHAETVGREQSAVLGDDEGRGVGEREKTEAERMGGHDGGTVVAAEDVIGCIARELNAHCATKRAWPDYCSTKF